MLRQRPLGESDRVIHLFSRERGKLHAVAKGARKPQSKFGGRLDLFRGVELTLHPGRSLNIITAVKTLAAPEWGRLIEPDVFAFLSYAAEVVDGLCEPDLPVPELYELLRDVREAAARGAAVERLMPVFDIGALKALGLSPELDACARCGSPLGRRPLAAGRARVSADAGGLICARCYDAEIATHTRAGIVSLTTPGLEALRGLRGVAPLDLLTTNADGFAHLPAATLQGVTRATHAFIEHHLGRKSRALTAAAQKPAARRKAVSRS